MVPNEMKRMGRRLPKRALGSKIIGKRPTGMPRSRCIDQEKGETEVQ